jgi:hypothetical protein
MAGGRPNKYITNIEPYLSEISILRSGGIEYEKIAKMIGIAPSTLYKHKLEIEEFSEATKKGTNILVEQLEATLYDLALGRVVKKKTKIIYDAEGKIRGSEVNEETMTPDNVSLFFALTNLAPDRWKHRQQVEEDTDEEQDKDMDELHEK